MLCPQFVSVSMERTTGGLWMGRRQGLKQGVYRVGRVQLKLLALSISCYFAQEEQDFWAQLQLGLCLHWAKGTGRGLKQTAVSSKKY